MLLIACRKSYSYERGIKETFIAKGTLLDSTGNCQKILVNGNYLKDTILNNKNFIKVQANIIATGKYIIYSDTVNGIWFRDSGFVSSKGLQSFTLKGFGTPLSPIESNFVAHFDSSLCNFTVFPDSAIFTFAAPNGSCPNFIVAGKYMTAAMLDSSNNVIVPIIVTKPGVFSIQTTNTNGMIFSSKGFFSKSGYYNLSLIGSGAPIMADTTIIPISVSKTNCSFQINVKLDSSMHWQFTVDGIVHAGYMYDSARTYIEHGINPNNTINGRQVFGYEYNVRVNNSLMVFIKRLNRVVTNGVYSSGIFNSDTDFVGSIYYWNGPINYASLPTFTIKVAIDPISKVVQGTFSGPVSNAQGQAVNLTNGEFKTYLGN